LLLVPGAKVTIASDAGASANPQESKGKDGAAN
jgi:hypothetical protein